MINRIYVLLLIIITLICSCDDGNPLIDNEKLLLDTYGELKDDTLYAFADTFIIGDPVVTGFSPKLLVGAYRDFQARSLLKFAGFPNDTMRLDSVQILISSIGAFGEKTSLVEATIYKIVEEWDNSVNTDEAWQDYMSKVNPQSVAKTSFNAVVQDTTEFIFDLPVNLVSEWQDTTSGDKNFGILIDYSNADFILECASRENSEILKAPRIVYIYTDIAQDTTIRDTVLTLQDASLISYTGTFDQNKIFVSSGYTTYAFFKFDFSVLPTNINISSVDFFFSRDTLSSIINPYRIQAVILRNSVTDYSLLPYYEIDSTFVSSVFYNVILTEETAKRLSLDNSIKAGIGQTFIQSIINKSIQNGSFYLEYSGKGNDISVYAIRGIHDADINARPQLKIQYYDVPKGRL